MKRAFVVAALSLTAVAALSAGASAQQVVLPPGFYLRGDVGGAFSTDTHFKDADPDNPSLGSGVRLRGDSGNSPILDVGIGMRVLPFLRGDLTLSSLPSLSFKGSDNRGLGTASQADVDSWVGMANGYLDINRLMPVFGGLEPYVDAGIGVARNHVGSMGSAIAGGTFASNTRTSLAWGLGAGVGVPVAPNVTLDVAYKYLDLGEMRTGPLETGTATGPIKADLAVHTFTVGARVGF